ncbi:hypothetical protein JHK82_029486 [Glycine max]|nr:hypothetical protein JHK85_030127 [Glycine max]KAG5005464.1 hypothetical protein JHK86_029603 [Glycine max]KAG5128651.1 hypothetical protein JHK82_029486 [Glycine max]KAG5153259.1 hypothetical protein JHK84_029731 [Glycine max]
MILVNLTLAFVNLLLKKVLNEGMDYMCIITYRQAISFIFMAPIACIYERKYKLEVHIISLLFLSALLGVTIPQYLFLLGLKYTSATFSCAFLNMVPVFTFIMAVPFGIEKVNVQSKSGKAKVMGTFVCIGGALLLVLYKGVPLINPQSQHIANKITSTPPTAKLEKWIIGSILLTLGCLLWSSWFIIQAKISKKYPCQYSSTAILSLFAAIQSAILSLVFKRNNASWILKGKLEIISVAYAIFVAMLDFSVLKEEIYLGRIYLGYCWHVYSSVGKKQRGRRATCSEGYTNKSGCRMSIAVPPMVMNNFDPNVSSKLCGIQIL